MDSANEPGTGRNTSICMEPELREMKEMEIMQREIDFEKCMGLILEECFSKMMVDPLKNQSALCMGRKRET